jgi:hypothetical protein
MILHRSTVARAVLTGLAAAVLVFPLLSVFDLFGRPTWWVLLSAFLGIAGLVTVGVLYRHARRQSDADGESVWDAIPEWQYEGRHVESGGLTRNEQEKALREVQDRAESDGGQSK